MGCGSGYKHQQNVFNISETHVLGGVAPGVITQSGEPGQDLRIVSCWTPNDALRDTVLTSGYAKGLGNAPMVGGSRAAGQAARAWSKMQQSEN